MNSQFPYTGLASDSRKVAPGFLFAALAGSREDGARFIADAVARGAKSVLARPEFRAAVTALGAEFVPAENPRAALARIAAAFFGAQPDNVVAVTGTNGKTSVSVFLRQIWERLGLRAASMGTIGIVGPAGAVPLSHTTPDPIELHKSLAVLKHDGVTHLALEASSHGLDQFRLEGLNIAAAGFTNITRDHLDYHQTFEHYLGAKLRLFSEIVRPGGVAVINADAPNAPAFIAASRERGLRVLTVGTMGETLRVIACNPSASGQALRISYMSGSHAVALPLAGQFQASNALVAAGLAIGLGADARAVLSALEGLRGADGRLEKVAISKLGAAIYVDYAHTPDALETVLQALRPHAARRLCVVFGCGGNRDAGKRPLMGKAAAAFADRIIVTDDNPRREDPAAIRAQVLSGCPGAREIGDRAEAIASAIGELQTGDVLVIAGKGHEQGQIVGDEVRPFLDRDQAVRAAIALGGHDAGAAG